MSQTVKIIYTATDDDTGKEVVGLEFRQGLMKAENVKAIEAALLPLFIAHIQEQQKSA